MPKKWRPEEDKLLIDNYRTRTELEIVSLLEDRKWHGIKIRASRLGLNRQSKDHDPQMIEDYKNGMGWLEINKKYNIEAVPFYRELKKHGVQAKRGLTDFGDDEAFIENYLSLPREDLTELYKVSFERIRVKACRLGIKRPRELKAHQLSVVDDELLKYDYLTLNLTAEQIEKKHKGKFGYTRRYINARLKALGIIKDSRVVQNQRMTTRLSHGYSLSGCYGKSEDGFRDWLNSLGFNFVSDVGVLQTLQLDCYDKSLNLAFEYNGLRFHSEMIIKDEKEAKSHMDFKRQLCLQKGIRLIHVFEDEWLARQTQVKGFIRSVLNKNDNRIYARKCKGELIDISTANDFVEQYHIQGKNTVAKMAAGLKHDDELLGVMIFGSHLYDSEDNRVFLDRLCFKENYSVVGGASKLFKFLLKETKVNEIWSWSDNRWSQGNVYEALGFELDGETKPDYSYVNTKKSYKKSFVRVSKQSQRKHKVKCPVGLTEKQWATERGLFRIWDCGKKRWVYRVGQ